VGIFEFDLIGEVTDLVSLGFAEVRVVGLLEQEDEVEDVIFGKIKLDDPRAAALSPPTECHPDLAQAAATDQQISPLRIFQQLLLEGPILPVTHPFGDLAGEMRSFNERECHPEKGTLYSVCVKGCRIQALQSTKSTPAAIRTTENPSRKFRLPLRPPL